MENENRLHLLQSIKLYLIICCFCLFFGSNLKAQEIRFIGSINYPGISNLSESNKSKIPITSIIDYSTTSSPTVKEIYTQSVGGKFGADLLLNQTISDAFVDIGLQFNLLRFKRVNKIIFPDLSEKLLCYEKGNELLFGTNQFNNVGNTSALYLEFPIHIGYQFLKKKLVTKIGIVQSFTIYSRQTKVDNAGSYFEDKSGEGINNLLLGVDIEASYLFYKQLEGFISYSRYFNDIYQEKFELAGKAKYNLFSIGIKYQLFNYYGKWK